MMKDAYSFHANYADLEREYRNMYDAYSRIFTRLGLKFRAVAADTGAIGGTGSHEFHVLADSGEDAIAYSPASDFAANVELAEAVAPRQPRAAATKNMQKVPTPGKTTCEDVAALLDLPLSQSVKALAVVNQDRMYMLLVRGDHQLNEVKASKLPGLDGFRFASEKEIEARIGCRPGYIGPVGVSPDVVVIADRSVAAMSDFVCGANEAGFHLTGVNFVRDLPEPAIVADIRNAIAGDPSPDGRGTLELCRGIEVGHIFQLRSKYSEAMKATFLNEGGKAQALEMGCYGIGVSRIVAAAIEQGNDEKGIVWPLPMAPFQVAIAPIGYRKNAEIKRVADQLHDELQAAGVDVLLDDRDERPGVMFADLELIGVPHRVTIGERGLKDGRIEYQGRTDESATPIELQKAAGHLTSLCG
jgi:prolyl-tRNA synthetase